MIVILGLIMIIEQSAFGRCNSRIVQKMALQKTEDLYRQMVRVPRTSEVYSLLITTPSITWWH